MAAAAPWWPCVRCCRPLADVFGPARTRAVAVQSPEQGTAGPVSVGSALLGFTHPPPAQEVVVPVRRVALADLEAAVADLEAKCRIVEIGYPDEGSAVIRFEVRGKRTSPGDEESR